MASSRRPPVFYQRTHFMGGPPLSARADRRGIVGPSSQETESGATSAVHGRLGRQKMRYHREGGRERESGWENAARMK